MKRLPYIVPGDRRADLTADRRLRERDSLAGGEPVDVLVVGGGVTGVGVALDAASRGLSVALVEKDDLANGTSRWSSKLIHGGLRYLAHGDVGVVWESAAERALLMSVIAPHLTRALAQVVPVASRQVVAPLMAGAGFVAGDVFKVAVRTRHGVLPHPRYVGRSTLRRMAPAVDPSARGGIVNYDGQLEDDARLVVAIARTAAWFGARILTGVRAVSVGDGGALVEDESGGQFEIRATHVVNATGIWAGTLDPAVAIRPSRGTHVVLRSTLLGSPHAALTVAVPGDLSRYVFALPQADGLIFAGITDVASDAPVDGPPRASDEEIAWILDVLSTALAKPVTPADAVGAFAGLRPLVGAADDEDGDTSDVSRRHLVREDGRGLITVTGGKLTTYRKMAQDVVDLITETPCRTKGIPLVGAGPLSVDAAAAPTRLVRRFGVEAALVADAAADDSRLLEPLAPGLPVLGIELVHALRREGARTLDDLISRRTRLTLVPADAEAARPRAEELFAEFGAH